MFIALIFSASVLFGSAGVTAAAPITAPFVAATAVAAGMVGQASAAAADATPAQ
jgi:hypothetical protein